VDVAILAGGFRVERAFAAFLKGIGNQSGAIGAEEDFPADDLPGRDFYPVPVLMLCPAEDPDKVEKDLQVLFLGVRRLFHEFHTRGKMPRKG
jgi:hypothetical protein